MATYGIVIFFDLSYLLIKKIGWRALWKVIVWGVSANLFFLFFVYLSGYDLKAILNIVAWGKQYLHDDPEPYIYHLLFSVSTFTPITILSFLSGMYVILRSYKDSMRIILLIVSSLMPFLYLGFYPELKFIFSFLPVLFTIMILGIDHIYQIMNKQRVFELLFWILLVLPWVVGIKVYSDKTIWGPGFAIKDSIASDLYMKDGGFYNKVKLTGGAGFAFPTSEGIRPLGGYAYMLYGGELKSLNKKIDNEVDKIIEIAVRDSISIYTSKLNPFVLGGLCRNGYQTNDSCEQKGHFTKRRFYKGDKMVSIITANDTKDIYDVEELTKVVNNKPFIAYYSFAGILSEFIKKANSHHLSATKRTGPFSCLFSFK